MRSLPLCALLLLVPLAMPAPARATAADTLADPARLERWSDDLRTLRIELPRRHGDLFWRTPARVFRAGLDSLERALPARPDWLVTADIGRLCALADAHTTLQWQDAATGYHLLPVRFEHFADGWRVVGIRREYEGLIGARLTAVGGIAVDRAAGALAPFLSHENEPWLAEKLVAGFVYPELLAAAGLAADADSASFALEDEQHGRVVVTLRTPRSAGDGEYRSRPRRTPYPDRALDHDAYGFRILPEKRALYFRYNACVRIDTLPFATFAARMWAAADSARVERVVVDLRANTGGNSRVWEPFVRGLLARPGLARKDRLAVLIGGRTYSSAVLDAWELRDHATFIGEPTGGKPNGWGEVKSFRLPHSRLDIQYSTRYFRLYRDTDPPSLMPELPVPSTWEDYRDGHDSALERALAR